MRLRLKVKEVAQKNGISMTRLGRIADVDYKTVQRAFHQPEGDFTLSTLARIATALKVHACDLLEEIPDKEVNAEEKSNRKSLL